MSGLSRRIVGAVSRLPVIAFCVLQQVPVPAPETALPPVQERVLVERVIIPLRVIDRFGSPVTGLKSADLKLRVDGVEVSIEALDELTEAAQVEEKRATSEPPEVPGPLTRTAPTRNVVMLFQWEIAGQKDTGFLRMMRQAEMMIEQSSPSDRFAVFGYGSSLRLLQDFTHDRDKLKKAIRAIRNPGYRGEPAAGVVPIADGFAGCGPTGSIGKAVRCIGESLERVQGPKSLIFFGWTIGRPARGAWFVEYPAMVDALGRSRTSVFVLDVSDGYHRLASGLKQIAMDTGGLYNAGCLLEITYCADFARAKTQRVIAEGGYDLVFRDPTGRPGWHEVEIETSRTDRIPIFQRWYRLRTAAETAATSLAR